MSQTTTPDAVDITHMQQSFADLPSFEFERAAQPFTFSDHELLTAARIDLATQDIDARKHDGWGYPHVGKYPEHLCVFFRDNKWPTSELATRVKLAAHRFRLCVAEYPDFLMVVGPREVGARAISLADHVEALQRHAQRVCAHE